MFESSPGTHRARVCPDSLVAVFRYQKRLDLRSNLVCVSFQREMTRVEEMDLRVWIIARERFGSCRQEERIILPPHRQ